MPSSRTAASAKTTAATPGGVPGGRGTASATPGLEFGPPGPGVPDGTDAGGDWYLAGVQQKIWMLWNQQIKSGFTQSVGVTFTILPDGNVTGVRVTQPSGASLLDMAAQRAVLNAAPFGPLPREYGQNPRTIQALFKPASDAPPRHAVAERHYLVRSPLPVRCPLSVVPLSLSVVPLSRRSLPHEGPS